MSKQPYSLQNIIPLIVQAEQEFTKYGSKATDARAADRKAKNIFYSCLTISLIFLLIFNTRP